ncbi:DnaA N-terminal domain-containing protein [Candidatus Clostridium radicumherbarum]|uniref:DnaA N-terminal domain-containing protein n=1 Tax=Candidatus Clostridium radicumherbarum TaxID=3381662 RepID=A0ABW8TP67_9CLOT
MSISKLNNQISEVLKQEYNEVIYTAWLSFIETAELENENIVVSVPNQYIKETFLERYANDVEELYRNCFNFNKLIIKTLADGEFKPSIGYPLYLSSSDADISEIVNSYVKDIYDFIEAASKNGDTKVTLEFLKDSAFIEELYFRIKEFLLNKGFKTELLTSGNNYTLSLSW